MGMIINLRLFSSCIYNVVIQTFCATRILVACQLTFVNEDYDSFLQAKTLSYENTLHHLLTTYFLLANFEKIKQSTLESCKRNVSCIPKALQ